MASSRARDTAQIAVFAGLIAALTVPGQLMLGPTGIPITLQTLGVLLAGAILGPRKGPLAVALYLLVGLVGVPVFAGGSAGPAVFVGPTGGFLVGFILMAWVAGVVSARVLPRYPFWLALGGNLLAGASVYLLGLPWFAYVAGAPALVFLAPFVPGDLLKVVVATLVAKSVHRAWPGIFDIRRRPSVASEPSPGASAA